MMKGQWPCAGRKWIVKTHRHMPPYTHKHQQAKHRTFNGMAAACANNENVFVPNGEIILIIPISHEYSIT